MTNEYVKKRNARGGLYDPHNEHDACGLGFIANIKGGKSQKIVEDGIRILENLEHRGATGAEPLMGGGAGILVQIPPYSFVEGFGDMGTGLHTEAAQNRGPGVVGER